MSVVVWKENEFPRFGYSLRAIPDSDPHAAFDDEVVVDQVGSRPQKRAALLRVESIQETPRFEELCVKKHSPGELSSLQNFR
jgi:hypothetical protein